MPQCQVSRSCQPSQALNPDKIEQKVDLNIPKGGSISFEFVKENGKTGSVSDFSDRTLSYVNSEGLYELKKGEDGKHRVNITGEIESLKAVIKNANGTIAWSGDLVEVGKSAEKKPVEKKVEEPKAEVAKTTEVRPKEGTSTEGALVDYGPLRLPLPDVSRSVNNPPQLEPRPELPVPDLTQPLKARGFGSGSESAEPSLKVDIPMPMDSLELVPVPEGEPSVRPAPMLDVDELPVLQQGLDVSKLEAGKTYNYKLIDGPEKGRTATFVVPRDGSAMDIVGHDRGYIHTNNDGTYRFENRGNYKWEITAVDGRSGQPSSQTKPLGRDENGSKEDRREQKIEERQERQENRQNRKGINFGQVNHLSGVDAEQVIRDNPDLDVIVVSSKWWCGPCKQYEPTYTSFAASNPNIAVIKVADDAQFDSNYGISSAPITLIKPAGSTSLQDPIPGKLMEHEMHDHFRQAQAKIPK